MQVAARFTSGAIDEAEARSELASLAWESGSWRQPVIAHYGVQRDFNISRLCDATLDNVERLILDRILDGASGSSALVIERIAEGGSLCGWIWKLARAAVLSEERRAINAMTYGGDLVGDLEERLDSESSEYGGPEDALDAPSGLSDEHADALIGEFRQQVEKVPPRARPTASVHERAETVCKAFGLPRPTRLACRSGSDQLRSLLATDESAPWRQARAFVDGDVTETGAQLMAIYNFDRRLVAGLADLDERVALALALASLTPIPRVRRKAMVAVRDALMASDVLRHRTYALAAAWGETQTEVSVTGIKSEEEIEADRRRFEELAQAELDAGLVGWGATPAELAARATEIAQCAPEAEEVSA